MKRFSNTLSMERLGKYKIKPHLKDADIINLYLMNIRLSEALYPALALLEVSLRNKIYFELGKKLNNSDWLFSGTILMQKESCRVQEAVNSLRNKYPQIEDFANGQIIAELNFGFWINLLRKSYKPTLWLKTGYFEAIFPNFNIKIPDRVTYIHNKLYKIKRLRDRIAHHENILNLSPQFDACYKDIFDILGYICVDTQDLLKGIFRFNDVYKEFMDLKAKL